MYYERKHIYFFSAPICCRDFYCESLRDSKNRLNHGFATPNLGQFCAVTVADRIQQKQTIFLPALDTSYLITKNGKN